VWQIAQALPRIDKSALSIRFTSLGTSEGGEGGSGAESSESGKSKGKTELGMAGVEKALEVRLLPPPSPRFFSGTSSCALPWSLLLAGFPPATSGVTSGPP